MGNGKCKARQTTRSHTIGNVLRGYSIEELRADRYAEMCEITEELPCKA